MSSSTSDSDAASSSASSRAWSHAWGRWLAWFATILFGGTAWLYLFVIVADPYSTGRFTPFKDVDIAITWRHLANAGRARDQQFDAAVFGNSRAMRFDPSRLGQMTGRRFVQLSVFATGPNEQLAVAKAFVRAHQGQAVLLLWGLDHLWCHDQNTEPLEAAGFPYWLYGGDTLDYLRHVFSSDALQAAFHRIAIRVLHVPQAGAVDGRPEGDGMGIAQVAAAQTRMQRGLRPTGSPNDQPIHFPSIERLAEFVRGLPADVQNVFVFTPYHVSAVPEPGSPADVALAACKRRLSALTGSRPRTVVIDWMRDSDPTRDPGNFWDETHPRDPLVRMVESDIATALAKTGK